MRLLLDSNILIAMTRGELHVLGPRIRPVLMSPGNSSFASAASLWEIAIKTRLGKLDPGMELTEIAGYLRATGIEILAVDELHAIALALPEPRTSDPFDRLLLAQCQVEGLRLVTRDRLLADHPLAWRPDPA